MTLGYCQYRTGRQRADISFAGICVPVTVSSMSRDTSLLVSLVEAREAVGMRRRDTELAKPPLPQHFSGSQWQPCPEFRDMSYMTNAGA